MLKTPTFALNDNRLGSYAIKMRSGDATESYNFQFHLTFLENGEAHTYRCAFGIFAIYKKTTN